MSIITSLLETLRLRAKVFHNAQYCGRWGVDISGTAQTSFHFVAHGHCEFRLRSAPTRTIALSPGDLLVFPRDASHIVGTADCIVEQVNQSSSRSLTEGILPDSVGLTCGHFEFDHPGPNPVIAALPEYVLLQTTLPPHNGLLRPVVAALEHESRNESDGSGVVIDRLAEILFVHLVRTTLGEGSDTPGLAAALGDDRIRRALTLIHEQPSTKWSVSDLAAAAAMSRSAFAERFKQLSGMAPMEYCVQWRMQQAYRWLADENISVLDAALRAGYEAESSFSRAFKRVIGRSPGSVRRTARF